MTRFLCTTLIVLFLTGCSTAPGRIYTNITRPFSDDFNNTSIGSKQVILDEHSIKEPISGYGASFQWSNAQIMSAARKAGITHIAFIEEQTLSILFGIYERKRLVIYGD